LPIAAEYQIAGHQNFEQGGEQNVENFRKNGLQPIVAP